MMTDFSDQGLVRKLALNQPTEKEITKVLLDILNKESFSFNIAENKAMVTDVVAKSNKDLRSAIQLLQFYSAGRNQEKVGLK